jgi:hypothetical protein
LATQKGRYTLNFPEFFYLANNFRAGLLQNKRGHYRSRAVLFGISLQNGGYQKNYIPVGNDMFIGQGCFSGSHITFFNAHRGKKSTGPASRLDQPISFPDP